MELGQLSRPWMLALWAVLVLVAAAAGWFLTRRRNRARDLPVAGTSRLERSPAYRAALRRYQVLLAGAALGALVALAGAALLSARPQLSETREPEKVSRDIVLCLDISGSMVSTDADILRSFKEIVAGLDGDRVGMSIFNGSPVTVFPLTDDKEFINERLDEAIKAFESHDETYVAGTFSRRGASLIGDGLTDCLGKFDHLDSERPRSVILATDNEVNGTEIVPLEQATEMAKDQKVRVFGIAPHTSRESHLQEFRERSEATGGSVHELGGLAGGQDVVRQITDQEAERIPDQHPERMTYDTPLPGAMLLLLGVAGMLVCLARSDR